MYNVKQRIYKYFDKTQKSMLCTFLRSFCKVEVKLSEDNETKLSVEGIFDKFIEEQKYYLEINASRFPFLENYIDDETFKSETIEYIDACKKYYEYKRSQAPLIEKQKEYDKKKRKFLQELKMSKQKPTQKQIFYYDRLCKKYGLEKKTDLSKLDMKNEIERIINEHSGDYKNINIGRN